MQILKFANVVKIWKYLWLLVFRLPLFCSWFDFTRLLKSKLRHAKETVKNTVLKNISQTSQLSNKIVEEKLICASNWHSPYVSIYFYFKESSHKENEESSTCEGNEGGSLVDTEVISIFSLCKFRQLYFLGQISFNYPIFVFHIDLSK